MGVGLKKGDRPEPGQWTVVTVPVTAWTLLSGGSAWIAPSSIKSSTKARNLSWMVAATLPCG